MAELITVGSRAWVPANRWDLAVHLVRPDAVRGRVAVIIPYFEQPASLSRTYAALSLADLDDRYEVVIVDDGSHDHPPPLPPPNLAVCVRHLRQDDLGCRPGAARNLGVRHTDAEVLVFLDADTLPDPGTVRRLAAWPSVLPDALVVGRRDHVDLDGWRAQETGEWLRGERPAPEHRPDPDWLADGYRRTKNLLDADDWSYRYVISAVMGCSRTLFDDIGGFDEHRVRYGSEDWEFAARAFNNGAVLVHDPTAQAWHDEPDRADRDTPGADQNEEALWIASRVPEPHTRSAAVIHRFPDTVVIVDVRQAITESQLVAAIVSVLEAIPDVAIHLVSPVPRAGLCHFRHDPRVIAAPPTSDALLRARAQITMRAPLGWAHSALPELLARIRPGGDDIVHVTAGRMPARAGDELATVAATRAIGRQRRVSHGDLKLDARLTQRKWCCAHEVGAKVLTEDVDLQAFFAGWADWPNPTGARGVPHRAIRRREDQCSS